MQQALTALLLVLLPVNSTALSVDVHRQMTRVTLADSNIGGAMGVPAENSIVKFWLALYDLLAAPDPEGLDQGDAERFRALFPHKRTFTAYAIRGFLGFSQEEKPQIVGLDTFDRSGYLDGLEVVASGAASPDLDQRNMRRYAYDNDGNVLKLPDGRIVPADPMILNMGEVDKLSSQAHAHYQLAADKPSDSADVLQQEPWNFVIAAGFPGPVETYAAEMAQLHLDIAIVAREWTQENISSTGEYLMLTWWGAGMHYLQDAAGPLHNVQVGSYELFKLAKLTWYRMAVETIGGYGGTLPSFVSIGLGFLHNHHLFAEQWLGEQVELLVAKKPAAKPLQEAWDKLGDNDPEFLAAIKGKIEPHMDNSKAPPWDKGEGAATVLVRALAELGKKDGQAMYDAAMGASSDLLRDPNFRLGDDEHLSAKHKGDPKDPAVQAAQNKLAQLHAKSLRRLATATRIYRDSLDGSPRAALLRLRRWCLKRLEAEAARRKQYIAAPPPKSLAVVQEPLWAVAPTGSVLLLLGGVWLVLRRRASKAT